MLCDFLLSLDQFISFILQFFQLFRPFALSRTNLRIALLQLLESFLTARKFQFKFLDFLSAYIRWLDRLSFLKLRLGLNFCLESLLEVQGDQYTLITQDVFVLFAFYL